MSSPGRKVYRAKPTGAPVPRGPFFFALLSVAVSLAVLGLKLGAWRLTGSVALLSDALESIVNVVAAVVAAWMVRVAKKPPDREHPYGHGKAEYFSAVGEGVLIIVAAFTIAREAWQRLGDAPPVESLGAGLGLSALATAINTAMSLALLRAGRRHDSPALTADGHHLMTDVITSVGVIVGIGLAALTGWWLLDPLIAIVVAVNIVHIGWKTVRRSVGGLMDEALPEAQMVRLRQAIADNMGGALEVHALRTRKAGAQPFLACHLVVPGDMSVREAHAICDDIERALLEIIPGASITIHVEPESKAELHTGERVAAVGEAEGQASS